MKIVVTGPNQSGKSSYIRFLDQNSLNVEVGGKTVAMDIGLVRLNGFHVSLFGTPGLLRFSVMSNILANGADGIVFIFDSVNLNSDKDAISMLSSIRKMNVPIVYIANKQDVKNARPYELVKEHNKLPENSKIFPASAINGTNVKESIVYLVNEIFKKYEKLLELLRNYESNIKGLAEKLKKDKTQMRDFLNALEIKRFIEIDRINKTYRVKELTNLI